MKDINAPELNDRRVAVLNRLRNALISTYGCLEGWPRINLGPCGRFARDLYEQWNARFNEKVNIVFLMTQDGSTCNHIVVRLPDGNLYDGGFGVVTNESYQMIIPDIRLDEMKDFDLTLLDKWSYGLNRNYPNCPNYSDDGTRKLIANHLAELPMTNPQGMEAIQLPSEEEIRVAYQEGEEAVIELFRRTFEKPQTFPR